MNEVTHCYVAREEGVPGCHSACADMTEMKKCTAKYVAEEVRAGFVVERVTTERAREMLGEYLKYRAEQKAVKAAVDLFTAA